MRNAQLADELPAFGGPASVGWRGRGPGERHSHHRRCHEQSGCHPRRGAGASEASRAVQYFRDHVAGFEASRLHQTAPTIGIRETRRLLGRDARRRRYPSRRTAVGLDRARGVADRCASSRRFHRLPRHVRCPQPYGIRTDPCRPFHRRLIADRTLHLRGRGVLGWTASAQPAPRLATPPDRRRSCASVDPAARGRYRRAPVPTANRRVRSWRPPTSEDLSNLP